MQSVGASRHHGASFASGLVHSSWFLLAWGVVAFASIWKFWRLTAAYRSKLQQAPMGSEAARQRLERSWSRSHGKS
ncbi:MAG: hypothetical protein CMN96_07325 [Synechococcus sp. MED850]|nr:hypothetical protein [Synechococcus sp. MED850]